MEPHAAEGRPGFWPTCLAVFVAGWVGGFAAGLLWGFFGTYGSAVQVLRGFGETPGTGSPLDSILIALVGPTVLRAVVGAVVLPSVLRWATGAEVSRLVAGLALGVGGLVAAGGWYALARSGAIMTPGYSFVPTVVGFLVSVAFVRALVGRRRRPEGETSRLKAFALVAGAPLAILLIGVLVLSGFARDGAGGGRVERGAYQAATLKAERIFVRSYRAAAALDSGGLGSGGILDQAQTELRSAAAELEEVRRGRKPVWTTRTIFSSPAWRPSPTTSTRWARIRPPRCRTQRRSEASARRSSTSTQRATGSIRAPGSWPASPAP